MVLGSTIAQPIGVLSTLGLLESAIAHEDTTWLREHLAGKHDQKTHGHGHVAMTDMSTWTVYKPAVAKVKYHQVGDLPVSIADVRTKGTRTAPLAALEKVLTDEIPRHHLMAVHPTSTKGLTIIVQDTAGNANIAGKIGKAAGTYTPNPSKPLKMSDGRIIQTQGDHLNIGHSSGLFGPSNMRGTLIHEVGHRAQYVLGHEEHEEWRAIADATYKDNRGGWMSYPHDYYRAGKIDAGRREVYADGYRMYIDAPGNLKTEYPDVYAFMKDKVFTE